MATPVPAPQDIAPFAGGPTQTPVVTLAVTAKALPRKRATRKKRNVPLTNTDGDAVLDGMVKITDDGIAPLAPLAANERRKLTYPDRGYIESRASERRMLYGGTDPAEPVAWQIPTTYDGLVQAVRGRRKGQVKPAIPASYAKTAKDVRPGQSLIDDVIAVVASTLTNGTRKFSMIPDDESQQEQDRAAKLKRWVMAYILGADGRPSRLEEECGEPWIDLGIEQACADGRAIWEVCLREELWSTAYGYPVEDSFADDGETADDGTPIPPEKRQTKRQKYLKAGDRFMKHAPAPIQVQRVDPLCYCDWRLNGKPFEAIKIEMRSLREVYPLYGLWRDGAGFTGEPYQRGGLGTANDEGMQVVGEPYPPDQLPPVTGQMQARCVTFWKADPTLMNDKGEVPVVGVYLVDGVQVHQWATIGPVWHPLPFFPFHGMHTSLPDPAFKGVSIAFRLLRLCDAIDTLLSMKLNVAALFSMPSWKWTRPENGQFDINTGGAGAAAASGVQAASSSFGGTRQFEPAMIYDTGPGEDILPIVPPPQAVAVLDSLKADLLEFINLVGLPAALRGISPGSGSAGYMVAQLIAAARTKLAPILKNASSALVSLIKYVLWKVEHHFSEGVPVQAYGTWLTLLPKDIDGRYLCELAIEPLLPVDQIQQEEHAMKMHDAGVISMRRVREQYVGLDNASDENEQIEAERIQQNKLIALPRALDAAVRLGRITPEEARAIKAKEFGIPYNSPAAALGTGILLGPNGQPIAPSGAPPMLTPEAVPALMAAVGPVPPPATTPGVPLPPSVPPVAPTPPDVHGPPAIAQLQGAVGTNGGPQQQPNRAAAAVGQ